MAHCAMCGKHTQFGRNKSFSQRRTSRTYKANLQKTRVLENGRLVQKTVCTKCLKAVAKNQD
jgi:large subunit ribosomal protein L28